MRTGSLVAAAAFTLGLATAAWAITGKDGWTATTATTAGAVRAGSTYLPGFSGKRWQDLGAMRFWALSTSQLSYSGQRDAIAADASGNLFALVWGYDTSASGTQYYGLVRVSGSTITTLVQESGEAGPFTQGIRFVGTSLERVVVSPSDVGPLTKGHPVVVRYVDPSADSPLETGDYEVVSVDPATGAQTLLHRFAGRTRRFSSLAIDGSGTATDGTIYLGDRSGPISRLTWSGTSWVADTVPGAGAPVGLRVGPDGALYTCSIGWEGPPQGSADRPIQRMNPATGATSPWGYVNGSAMISAWDCAADGTLWFGLHDTHKSKNPDYVTRGVPGGVTSINSRISESSSPTRCVAGAGGAVYVLDSTDTIHVLRP